MGLSVPRVDPQLHSLKQEEGLAITLVILLWGCLKQSEPVAQPLHLTPLSTGELCHLFQRREQASDASLPLKNAESQDNEEFVSY